ncbi:thiamine diphosphokinase [uncultured Faecalicoccus sp.]|uniref:thiamine diphosphokinase n=1 Tax=uncultured Faecalicoccus sp. TaxID=1971760 RepID=UPI0025FC0874|nr:thiamine diphosphokinase [uncultured Faecalicoccus sp.]
MRPAVLVTPLAQKIPKIENADYIGIDAGCLRILEAGLKLSYGIGDFDSMDRDTLASLKKQTSLQIHPVKKDETDSELALSIARQGGFSPLILVGALGGRIDHSLANIRLLMYRYDDLILWEEDQRVFVLLEGEHVLSNEFKHVSFLAIEDSILSLEGFLYPLSHAALHVQDIYTTSNTIQEKQGIVTVKKGKLLCILTNRT